MTTICAPELHANKLLSLFNLDPEQLDNNRFLLALNGVKLNSMFMLESCNLARSLFMDAAS